MKPERFTFGKDWRSWIIGIAWDSRQFALAIGPFCWVYWRGKHRNELAQIAAERAERNSQLTDKTRTGHARRRRRR